MPKKQTKVAKAKTPTKTITSVNNNKIKTPISKKESKKDVVKKQEKQENKKPETINPTSSTFHTDLVAIAEQSRKAVEALKKHAKEKKTKSLFQDLPVRLTLEVTAFKVPTLQTGHFFNILLRNSIHPTASDVVLIIKHDKKKDKNTEDYLEPEMKASLFKDKLLTEHGIKLREVITLQQLREEYSTFEAKRAFVQRIDALLVDKPLAKFIPGILGRELFKRKKYPIAVSLLENRNLAQEIEKGLKKTVLNISTRGNTSTIQIGTDELTTDALIENIGKICRSLKKKFPGGWPNISKLSVAMNDVPPLIIHFSKGGPEDIVKPIRKLRKRAEPADDEISTQVNKRVKVYPNGVIKVTKIKDDSEKKEEKAASESEGEESDSSSE